jgi:hypothetical protein
MVPDRAAAAVEDSAYLSFAPGNVEEMFTGQENLRSIHDALIELGRSLGSDVKVCPCRTIVPLYRKYQFAQVKPTTKTRIVFGLAFGDTKATGRLSDAGGFAKKDRSTHRIPISDVKEIDAEVTKWLKTA